MGLRIVCPNCGERPYTEFSFGGELPPAPVAGESEDNEFDRVWLKRNVAGPQDERWFHAFGCRRWFSIERDTATNEVIRGA